MTRRPLVIERLCPWHLPFIRLEALRGRTAWLRSIDPRLEGSAALAAALASSTLRELRLRRPLIAYLGPETDLAIALISERYDDIAGEISATRWIERLYGERLIHQAYRKALADELTRYFELARLAEAARDSLGQEVDVVPAALRDVEAFLLGRRLTSDWTHPDAPTSAAGLPGWLRTAHAVHVTIRGGRAAAVMAREAFAPRASSPRSKERYDVAFAVVGPTRELQSTKRGIGFLLDGESLRSDRALFIPSLPLTTGQSSAVRARRLHLAREGRGPVDRRVALRAVAANFLRRDWVARTTAELLRSYRRWGGFTDRYEFPTFVSYADTGVWPVARNVLFRTRGIRTIGYSDSGNHGFHPGQTQSSHGPTITHLAYLLYDEFATWNDRLVRFLAAHAQKVGRYHVIGCPWTDHVSAFRRMRDRGVLMPDLRSRLEALGPRPSLIAVFDSWYYVHGVHQPDDLARFLEDLLRLADERPDILVALKRKVPVRFREANARRIYALHDRFDAHPRALVLPPSADTSAVAAAADVVVSFPFTSVSHEALGAGVKGVYYDANEKLRGWYYDLFPGLMLHGYQELRLGIDRMLRTDDEDFLRSAASAQERPTELYLDTGAVARLRSIIADREAQPTRSA